MFILVEIFTTGIWSGMTSLVAIPSLFISIFTKTNEWWMILIQVKVDKKVNVRMLTFLHLWGGIPPQKGEVCQRFKSRRVLQNISRI
ncbi:hypothetical protein ONA02_06170 [Mycoplasmopsis felis]|uniref:hypothetical protein n=1 Tax=Mycoplasmopsis felis TaxID=33923 RepID=UPI002285CA16|nr:hypothetical protein [Mycoplasmopsis felis]WAM02151.1 hypothetical protein ONA02_06170 [Mycoplasmopsis felis]